MAQVRRGTYMVSPALAVVMGIWFRAVISVIGSVFLRLRCTFVRRLAGEKNLGFGPNYLFLTTISRDPRHILAQNKAPGWTSGLWWLDG